MADDYFQIKSGASQQVTFSCALGNRCQVTKALRLQQAYFDALKRLDRESSRWSKHLEMARFVHEVAKSAAKSKEIKATDVWKNLRPKPGRSDDPTSYEQTYLHYDIQRIEKAIKRRRQEAEKAAEKLIAILSDKKFQKHLYVYHRDHQISPQMAAKVYHVSLSQTSDAKKGLQFREIDHYLALLTEHLSATQKGMEFLGKVIDKDFVKDKKNIAFADVWGFTTKAKSLSEPVGKFVYNVTPVLTAKIQILINQGKVKTIDDILRDPDLKNHFAFLKEKLDFDVPGWLKKRANDFGNKSKAAKDFLQRRNDWKNSVKQFQDVFDEADARKKIDSAWMGLTMDTVAFAISIVKIASDFKKSKWNDWMGLVGDFTGLVKTVAEVRTARILLVSGEGESLQAAKAFTKRLGVLAGVAAVIITIGEIYKGVKGGDWDVVALNSAGLVITGVGIYAAFMEAALMSGICTVLAVILAIITALVLDPKVIDYLEDTYWGEDFRSGAAIAIGKTMHEFYKRMFDLKLYFEINEYDKNESHIMVQCGMMADATPVFVEVIHQKSKKSLGKKRVFPMYKNVRGKGKVEKDGPSWSEHWPFYAKRIRIKQPWNIWGGSNGIKRDNATEYIIKAGMDPSRSKKMAIDKMAQHQAIDDVKFPAVQKPILWDASTGWTNNRVLVGDFGTKYCIQYPASGKLGLKVVTRYGSGCSINVRTMEDCTWPVNNQLISKTSAQVEGDETIIKVQVKAPKDDYYDFFATVTLVDANNKAIKSCTLPTFRMAHKSYIDKHKV